MIDTLTPDIEAIRNRAEAATPGPWRHVHGRLRPQFKMIINQVSAGGRAVVAWAGFDGLDASKTQIKADARFIAHAREDIPALLSAIAAYEAAMWTDATRDVLAERNRQIEMEGWTRDHDDEHDTGQLAAAAAAYALEASLLFPDVRTDEHQRLIQRIWPWDSQWWKPKDKRRNLVRAAALALAEIERLDRASLPPVPEGK